MLLQPALELNFSWTLPKSFILANWLGLSAPGPVGEVSSQQEDDHGSGGDVYRLHFFRRLKRPFAPRGGMRFLVIFRSRF
jgi:hypothetical protein